MPTVQYILISQRRAKSNDATAYSRLSPLVIFHLFTSVITQTVGSSVASTNHHGTSAPARVPAAYGLVHPIHSTTMALSMFAFIHLNKIPTQSTGRAFYDFLA